MGAQPRRCKVLLIDDSSVSLLVAETLLLQSGYEVRTAIELAEFERIVTSWQPDVILTDVQMPGMDGDELCRRLKATEQTAHVPVVLYSSRPAAELEALAARCGADGFVCKAKRHEDLPRELERIWTSLSAR